jgi:hypothetical protein
MNKTTKLTAALLMAGVFAGGAIAQTASATSDVPVKAGEASTQTNGVPNMVTNNTPNASAPVTSASGVAVDSAGATATMGAAPASSNAREVPNYNATSTSNVPTKAGEASTMTNGVPNAKTHNEVVNSTRVVTPPVLGVQNVPQQAGEASTMVGGNPNANPNDPILRRY